MAPSKSNAPEYSKDEKVLCFHLELLYEAKVLEVKQKDPNDKGDGFVYKIHYKGWKNTYVSRLFLRLILFPSWAAFASSRRLLVGVLAMETALGVGRQR